MRLNAARVQPERHDPVFNVCGCVRSEDEEDEDSLTGTKVRVKYGRGKTQKIYEAHIKKTDMDNGEQFYLVHYYGWNVRSVSPPPLMS